MDTGRFTPEVQGISTLLISQETNKLNILCFSTKLLALFSTGSMEFNKALSTIPNSKRKSGSLQPRLAQELKAPNMRFWNHRNFDYFKKF